MQSEPQSARGLGTKKYIQASTPHYLLRVHYKRGEKERKYCQESQKERVAGKREVGDGTTEMKKKNHDRQPASSNTADDAFQQTSGAATIVLSCRRCQKEGEKYCRMACHLRTVISDETNLR